MREIISMEIEQGVTITLSDGTRIIGGMKKEESYVSEENDQTIHGNIV